MRRDSLRGPWGAGQRAPGAAYSWIGVWERQGRSEAWIAQQLLVPVAEVRRRREGSLGSDRGSGDARPTPSRSRKRAVEAKRAEPAPAPHEELGSMIAEIGDELGPLAASHHPSDRPAPPSRDPDPVVSLGDVSVDELRGLGLSRTQARRLLRERDCGRVRSVADIEFVPGFPRAVRRVLAAALVD